MIDKMYHYVFFQLILDRLKDHLKIRLFINVHYFSLIMSRFKIRFGHYGGIVEIYVHYEYKEYIIYIQMF